MRVFRRGIEPRLVPDAQVRIILATLATRTAG